MAVELIPPVPVAGLFIGRVGLLPRESRGSAIAKAAVVGHCRVDTDGFAGDEHADMNAHGGPEKAVHLFPAEHLDALARAFPDARHLIPGGLGENISTRGLTEENVHIGDVFELGTARLQVAQPRTPCWKIDARCGVDGMAAHVAEHGISGWYFRVRTPGECTLADALVHVQRPPGSVSLARFHRGLHARRPALELLHRLAEAPGLAPDWMRKIRGRIDWLLANGDAQ